MLILKVQIQYQVLMISAAMGTTTIMQNLNPGTLDPKLKLENECAFLAFL
jgi:hypothetical protein